MLALSVTSVSTTAGRQESVDAFEPVTDDVGVAVPLEALVGAFEDLPVVVEIPGALGASVRVGKFAECAVFDGDHFEGRSVDFECVTFLGVALAAVDLGDLAVEGLPAHPFAREQRVGTDLGHVEQFGRSDKTVRLGGPDHGPPGLTDQGSYRQRMPTKASLDDVDPVAGGLYFLREELDCANLGVSVLECDPGWAGKPHDHAEDGQEEVYVLVEGETTVTVDGEDVSLEAGDALRLAPEEERRIHNGETESQFVLVGAP